MDTTQAKQIALDWLTLNAPNAKVTQASWGSDIAYVKLQHPEIERMSLELEIAYTRPGAYYDDADGNTRSKLELRLLVNWAAYGSVDIAHTAAHASLTQEALAILTGLKNILPAELDELVESAEEKILRVKRREEEKARDRAIDYVATYRLTSHLRAGGSKTVDVTLSDTQVTYASNDKVYSIVVESGLLTVTRVR